MCWPSLAQEEAAGLPSDLLVGFDLGGRGFGAPELAAVGAVIGDGEEFAIVEGGEQDLVADDHGRRGAAGRVDFPFHVFVGADFGGRMLVVGDACGAGAAELGPGAAGCSGRVVRGVGGQARAKAASEGEGCLHGIVSSGWHGERLQRLHFSSFARRRQAPALEIAESGCYIRYRDWQFFSDPFTRRNEL